MKPLLSLAFTFTLILCTAQGKVMLVGGGAESNASFAWSNTPYQWAVDQSNNKKVAVISYDHSESDEWLPNYFESLGASEASNIEIGTREEADSEATYDLLMQYDVFFFKGGNQARYYEYFQDTRVTDAVVDKFNDGGVMSGTSAGLAILSEVLFTAERGSVFPDQTLANLDDQDVILRNDFTSILPETLADSHFIERGRFGRLIAFLGKWFVENEERILGIGVDDRTAVCIANGTATVYGTGAASFYVLDDFEVNESRPVGTARSTQVLHNRQYDLNTKTVISEYTTNSSATLSEETGNYQLLLSGDGSLTHNESMLSEFANLIVEPLVIITEHEGSVAPFIAYLEEEGVNDYELVTTDTSVDPCDQVALRNTFRRSSSFLFLQNNTDQLFDFLDNHETGIALSEGLKRNGNVIALVGQDSRLAGAWFCTNNQEDEFNAYFGDLTFSEGLGLLETTIVMPHTFSTESTDFYENNSAAVLWSMFDKRLGYGLYLNENSYAHYYQEKGKNQLTSLGEHSSILVTNTSSTGGIATQQVNRSGDIRQVVGFDQMDYSLISGQSIEIGNAIGSEDAESAFEIIPAIKLTATLQEAIVRLTWETAVDELREGYRIFRSKTDSNFSLLAEVGADATSFEDTDVDEATEFTYYVVAFGQNTESCISREVTVSLVLGVNEPADWLYPNPVRGTQVIRFKGSEEIAKGYLFSNEGKELLALEVLGNQEVKIPSVEQGMYMLVLYFNGYSKAFRIIIQ